MTVSLKIKKLIDKKVFSLEFYNILKGKFTDKEIYNFVCIEYLKIPPYTPNTTKDKTINKDYKKIKMYIDSFDDESLNTDSILEKNISSTEELDIINIHPLLDDDNNL